MQKWLKYVGLTPFNNIARYCERLLGAEQDG